MGSTLLVKVGFNELEIVSFDYATFFLLLYAAYREIRETCGRG